MKDRTDGRVLLTGATGLLGSWLRRTAPADTDLVSVLHRRKLSGPAVAADLRDPEATTALAMVKPALVIHAAFARDEASILDATRHVVEATREASAELIYISSEAVFAGDGGARSEPSVPDPVWDYGRWKWEAEKVVSASDGRVAIVRLPLFVSLEPEDHILSDIRAAVTRNERSVWFSDEMRQPACADDLARAIWRIAKLPSAARAGPWHLPGAERLSRFEIAERAVTAANLEPSSIKATPSDANAHRPRDLNLTGKRAENEIGWSPRPIYRPVSATSPSPKWPGS